MKKFNLVLVFMFFILSCKTEKKEYKSFGMAIGADGAISHTQMWKNYKNLQPGDTLKTKFTATVIDVCKAKGCWMKVKLQDGNEAMITFKDYGFFMPKDITGKEVIVGGLGFVEEMTVDDQRHYAADGGKSQEEIAQIVSPKKTYGFEADGVLLLK